VRGHKIYRFVPFAPQETFQCGKPEMLRGFSFDAALLTQEADVAA
jgi:hypothetical protein